MFKLQTDQGEIQISDAVLSDITGAAATSCYGVKGMAYRSMTDGLVHLLRPTAMSKGVHITQHDEGDISIELHIIVEPGVNMRDHLAGALPRQQKHGCAYPQRRRLRRQHHDLGGTAATCTIPSPEPHLRKCCSSAPSP